MIFFHGISVAMKIDQEETHLIVPRQIFDFTQTN